MPAWTLATLMSETTAALGNRTDLAASRVSFFVNEAYRFVVEDLKQHNRQELKATTSTTSGDPCINLPTDFYELINLSNLSASPPELLRQVNTDFVDSYFTDSGTPRFFTSYATFIELVPTPDSAYSIQLRYRGEFSDMTATTATPSIATRYHYAVYLKAQEYCANFLGNVERAGMAHQLYDTYVRQSPTDAALRVRKNRRMGLSLRNALKFKETSFDLSDE